MANLFFLNVVMMTVDDTHAGHVQATTQRSCMLVLQVLCFGMHTKIESSLAYFSCNFFCCCSSCPKGQWLHRNLPSLQTLTQDSDLTIEPQ